MDHIWPVVEKYLDIESEHSLFINGKWGSGKTYYVKNQLKKYIEGKDMKMIYTSANGIKSFDEIRAQIISYKFSLAKLMNKKGARITFSLLGNASKFTLKSMGFDNFSEALSSIKINLNDFVDFDKDVLIIDDLERANYDKLPINEFLGTINNLFTEHSKIKVLLIGDEIELLNALKEKMEEYQITREKSIWRTIMYYPYYDPIIESFLSKLNLEEATLNFLKGYTDKINKLVSLSNVENLRNVKFYLENLEAIIKSIGLEKFKRIPDQLLQIVFIISNEYKKGGISADMYLKAPDYIKYAKTTIEYLVFESNELKAGPVKEDLSSIYGEIFNELGNNYTFIYSIYTAITTGELNSEKLNEEIDSLIGTQNIELDWNKSLNAITNFRNLNQEEFEVEFSKVIEYVKQSKYDLHSISTLISFSTHFIDKGMIKFKNGIQEFVDLIMQSIDGITDFTNTDEWTMALVYNELIREHPELEVVFKKMDEVQMEQHKRNMALIAIETRNKLINRVDEIQGVEFSNMLTFLPREEFDPILQEYLKDNKLANKLNEIIRKKWSYDRENTQCTANIKYLGSELKSRVDENEKITRYLIQELSENLSKRIR